MPAYLIGVPYPELEKVEDEVIAWLRKHGFLKASFDPLQILIFTEKELSEEELEELRELLMKKYSEAAGKMSLLGKWE